MQLDSATLWAVIGVVGATATGALTLLWWHGRTLPGLGPLALGHALLAASGALTAAAGRLPALLAFTGSNAVSVLGLALLVNGVRRLHGLPARGRWSTVLLVGAVTGLSLAGQAGLARQSALAVAAIVVTNTVLAGQFADAAWAALSRGRRSGETLLAAVLASSFSVVGAGRLAVAGLTAAGVGVAEYWRDRHAPPLVGAFLLASLVAGLSWTFGLFASVNRRLARQGLRQIEYRASLSEVALSLMDRLELAPLLEALVTRGTSLLEADRGFLYLETPGGTSLRRQVWVGDQPVDEELAPDEGAVGRAWHRCEPVQVEDYDEWPGRAPVVPRGIFGGMLAVPLRSGGRAVGALGVALGRGGRRFRDEQLALLGSFADLASIALENARLYEEARSEIQERRRAQSELERSETRYRDLFDQGLGLICTHDLQGRLLSVNPAAAQSLGTPAGELVGRSLHALVPEAQRGGVEAYLREIRARGHAEGVMTLAAARGTRTWRYRNVLREVAGVEPYVIGFAHDISEESRAERALRESEERFRQVADNLDAALFVRQVRPHAVLYASPAYRRIFGRDAGELAAGTDQLFSDVVPEDRPKVLAAFEAAERERQGFDQTYRIVRPDGGVRWVRTRAFPGLRGPDGEVARVVGISEDVTAIESAEALRADLVRMLVHDLRTPLTSIVGCLDVLAMAGPPGDPDIVSMAKKSARRLGQLVDDILEIDRLEQGALPLSRRAVDLSELLAEACALVSGAVERKSLSLAREIEEALPAAWVDPQLVLRALTNLLGNAVKFTPAGGRVVVRAEAGPSGTLSLCVQDSGPGVPLDLAPRLFQKFVTGSSAEAGSGLGLAFCRLVAEAHGGRIALEPGEVPGARFVLTLPALDRGGRA